MLVLSTRRWQVAWECVLNDYNRYTFCLCSDGSEKPQNKGAKDELAKELLNRKVRYLKHAIPDCQ